MLSRYQFIHFTLQHSSHNIRFRNREQKIRFLEYWKPALSNLGDFAEGANVTVCIRHFRNEETRPS